MTVAQGLAPYVPGPGRRDRPRWWVARGTHADRRGDLVLKDLCEQEGVPEAHGVTGLVAPCSLPRPFLDHLGLPGDRDEVLRALDGRTLKRLAHEARLFAARRPAGRRHPRRAPEESVSALDRRRLALFKAALPLLRSAPAVPWGAPRPPCLVEVDSVRLLAAWGLPATRLAGGSPETVRRRAGILDGLSEGAAGFPVKVGPRDLPLTSLPALEAVLAAAAAAWFLRNAPAPPTGAVEAWIPIPAGR
ncbi:MAG: hypothetical protein ACE5JG_00260 [Planctomycetota bacterium]